MGYIPDFATSEKLPALKPGILSPADIFETPPAEPAKISQLNILYARDYNVFTDAEIVWKGWKKLDK